MDLSIVIPVASDPRIKDCIASVDEDVGIVVVLNGATDEIKDIVRLLDVVTVEIAKPNLGAALEHGIRAARFSKVLLMDSDCTFGDWCVRKLYDGLADSSLAKGRIVFEYADLTSYIVARLREFHCGDLRNAFKPPLALRKSIVDQIGGYYFDTDIHWLEDVEFDERRSKFGVAIEFIDDAIIYHPPIGIRLDLRSAFRYGIGCRIGVSKGVLKPSAKSAKVPSALCSLLLEPVHLGSLPRRFLRVLKAKGVLTAIYCMVWRIAFRLGYYYQILYDPYEVTSSQKAL
jgi:glycosyltransferase involved in cell wall biosynthesis